MNLNQQIKTDEGLKLKPYKCSKRKLTIGYGYNLENGIPEYIADQLFDYSMQQATFGAISIMSTYELPIRTELKNILIQMVFQMGKQGVLGFKKMLTALKNQDYKTASKEMLNSQWHIETPARCERLSKEMSML